MDLLRLTFRSLWEKKYFIAFVSIELILLIFFFTFTYQQYELSQNSLDIYESMEFEGVTYFMRDTSTVSTSSNRGSIEPYLAEILDENHAYVLIPTTVEDQEGRSFEAYLALGKFSDVYGLKIDESSEPVAWVGSAYRELETGDQLEYGDHHRSLAAITGELPEEGGFLTANRTLPFDEAIIIEMSLSDYSQVAWTIDIQQYLMWSNPHPDELNEFLIRSDDVGLRLVPQQVASQIGARYENLLGSGAIGALTFALAIIFALTSILSQLYIFLKSKEKELLIHLVAGARTSQLYVAISLFIFLLLLIPLLAYNVLLRYIPELQMSWSVVFLVPIPIAVCLAAIGFKSLRIHDYFETRGETAS